MTPEVWEMHGWEKGTGPSTCLDLFMVVVRAWSFLREVPLPPADLCFLSPPLPSSYSRYQHFQPGLFQFSLGRARWKTGTSYIRVLYIYSWLPLLFLLNSQISSNQEAAILYICCMYSYMISVVRFCSIWFVHTLYYFRKGIASELLRACEELIIRMEAKRKVYLHCSATDPGPFELYQKAGYEVVKKDSILVWLCFKSPRYLMSKELPLDEKKSDALDCNCRPIWLSTLWCHKICGLLCMLKFYFSMRMLYTCI